MLYGLNIYVCALLIFFESCAVLLYLNGLVALKVVVDIEHVIATLTNCVCVYEQEVYQNVIYNVRKMGQLDPLLHYVLQIINLPAEHCKYYTC